MSDYSERIRDILNDLIKIANANRRKSAKGKFITADGISEIRNITYPPMPSLRFAVDRKIRMSSIDDGFSYDEPNLVTRDYRLEGQDGDGCFIYNEAKP